MSIMIKRLSVAAAVTTLLTVASSESGNARGGGGRNAPAAPVSVSGHITSHGTYVAPHMRSAPDHNPYNNWSVKPNVNPYTGQPGTHEPFPHGGLY